MKIILLAAASFCFFNFTYAQPGTVDPSFGTNGIVTTDLGENYTYATSSVTKVLSQPDGSMFVIQNSLSKRLANGRIDSSFGIDGYVTDTGFFMYSAFIQSDGKIVVAGSGNIRNDYPDIYQSDFEVARYNTDGSPDSSFSGDGKQTTDFGEPGAAISPDKAYSVSIQKDGKIIMAGSSNASLALARYNTDGSPDNTFDNDGKLVNNSVYAISMAIQKDDKIVVAGTVDNDFGVLRYNNDGSVDITFGNNGVQTADFAAAPDFVQTVAIQSDGKIVVAGSAVVNISNNAQDFALARFNIDGSLDKSFSGDGKQTTNFGNNYGINTIAFQKDGKIVAAGDSAGRAFALVRYNVDGSLDRSFSDDAKQTTAFGVSNFGNTPWTVDIQYDGKIVAGGSAYPYLALARYNKNGSPDNTFGQGGKLTDGFHAGNTLFKSIAVQKDGKAVSVGRTWNGSNFDFAIVRYNTDGSLDKTFSDEGKQIIDFAGKDDYANAIAIQSDGKIVVAGYSGKYDSSVFSIARFNTYGSLDNTFSNDGKLQTDFGFMVNEANAVIVQADGKIVVVGKALANGNYSYEDTDFAIARYNIDGSLDNTFDGDGKQTIRFTDDDGGIQSFATSAVIQPDGKIVVGGVVGHVGLNSSASVIRFNTNGSLDSAYSFIKSFSFGGDDQSSSIAIQKDGKVVQEAYFYYRGYGGFSLKRYNIDGSLDNSFDNDGIKIIDFDYESNIQISSLALQPDKKIIVGGSDLFRFNLNGSTDSTFGNNGVRKAAFFANDLAVENDKLYAVGKWTYYGAAARYLLDNDSNTPPTISITAPSDNATYIAPVNLQLAATAADADGTITKVEFYNDSTLLYTDTAAPYAFTWKKTPAGSYTLTAKATDNSGLTATSTAVHVSVVPNKASTVSIINPVNNRTFAAPAYIHFEALASDVDGRIIRVEFYSGSTLLKTEYKAPYGFVWKNLPVGIYTITAVATDNWGAQTMSAPVTVKVKSFNQSIVSSKPNAETNLFEAKTAISLKAWPNPVNKTLTVSTTGLHQNKPATVSILSATGVVIKTIRINNSTTQLDVSSLTSGVYTIKLLSGDKVLYKQFVKL